MPQNIAEAGNNCIDVVAAYLTNLRVMQTEEEPNPPVSLAMIQPRHSATVASVATKARELICELALARATVKPRKAPKNKAIESAARAAASSSGQSGSTSACASAVLSSSTLCSSGEGTGSSAEEVSESGCCVVDDAGSDSNEEFGEGHQDTSRDGNSPTTAREEEERLLCALQGPAAAEEMLKIARARPAGVSVVEGESSLGPSGVNDDKGKHMLDA